MGQTDSTPPKGGRKRRLNVIYFVDSARTRSFSMPIARLNFLLFGFLALVTWSVASVLLLAWLGQDRHDVTTRLRNALSTIFEYETRYDQVYETAYPNGARLTDPMASESVEDTDEPTSTASAPAVEAPAAVAATTPTTKKPSSTSPEQALAAKALMPKEAPAPADAAAPPTKPVAQAPDPAKAAATGAPPIVVSNPVVEAHPNELELRFDLTNKSQDRAEGYIWAVAEFKNDAGVVTHFGAPTSIAVQASGEPLQPQLSAVFGIKHFKKKSFTFPLSKGQTGTFTGLKIGVMDKSGANKTTYNVPIEIRVGGAAVKDGEAPPPQAGSQSG